ncbi:hypothetical protein C8R43DRAFT_959230 [Mycena crocata]|nr:hypothetical protein C8R43DRAFT_959230 [Mycena crocata]
MPFDSVSHRASLIRSNAYTAHPSFLSAFTFEKSGRGHILKEVQVGPIDPDGPATPDAIVVAIGVVSHSDASIGPVGNWGPQFAEKTPIQKAKYVLIINKPTRDAVFAPDFSTTISTLKKLQDSISKTHDNRYLTINDAGEDGLRFAFHVFQPKSSNAESVHKIESWPVPGNCVRDLDKIKENWMIRDFRVFDIDRTAVEPLDIPSKLVPGTLVECAFKIEHHSFTNQDAFGGTVCASSAV